MNSLSGAALLALGVATSVLLTGLTFRDKVESEGIGSLGVLLSAWTYFFAIVIGAFHIAGYVEIVVGIAAVSTTSAAWTTLIVFVIALGAHRCAQVRGRQGFVLIFDAVRSGTRAVIHCEPKWVVVSAVALIVLLAVSSFIIGYPRGTEALAYHLPNGVWALQNESLHLRDKIYYSALPANDGLWYSLLLTTLSERFVAMGEVPFLPMLALTIYGISRKAGADTRGATLSAVGILSLPLIALQAMTAESDVAGLTFLSIALYFLLSSEPGNGRYVVAGLAVGLAFGFKTLNLIAGALLATVALVEPWFRRGERSRWYVKTGLMWVAALALGSFWAVRNAVETGNPLYPVYVKFLFDTIGWPSAWDIDYGAFLDGQFRWVRSAQEWLFYPWIEWHYADSGTHYKSNAGLGAYFAAAIPLTWLHALVTMVIARERNIVDESQRARLILVCGGTALVAAWYLIGNREPRYVSAAWIFIAPLAGYTIASINRRPRQWLEGLLSVCAAWMLFIFVARELIVFGDRIIYSRHFSRHMHYEYPVEVDRLPSNSTIVNLDDRPANYMLAGDRLSNRVIDYQWSVRNFGVDVSPKSTHELSLDRDAKGLLLTAKKLADLRATHVYYRAKTPLRHDECIQLRELSRLDRNPVSGARVDPPKILLQLDLANCGVDPDAASGVNAGPSQR